MVDRVGCVYLPDEADEAVLALATDSDNQVLVSGDTAGCVSVWDISDYCACVQSQVSEANSHSLVVLCPNDGLPGNNCYQAIFGIKRSAIIFPIKWSKVLFDPLWGNFFIS